VTERSTPGGELVDPSDILSAVEALRGCVDAYLVTGNFEEAIATISAAIELQPDNPVLYADRGYAYLQMDEPRKAADDFARVIDLAPLIPVGYLGRGLSYVAIQSPRAFADLDKAIELGARDGYWYRGIAWYFVDEPEKALEDVRVYIEQAPDGQYAGEARLLEKRLLDYIALRESQRKIREEGQ
jgi:regulator of sirC expression with transglutaminase-like and TPR domain